MTDSELIQCLRDALQEGLCVPFIGAGASVSVGGPDWPGYVRQLFTGLDNPQELEMRTKQPGVDLAGIASYAASLRRQKGLPPPQVRLNTASPVHDTLAAWKAPLYLTTNYDDGMERGFHDHGEPCDSLKNDQLGQFDLWNRSAGPVVLKLCSSTRHRPNTGAVDCDEFAQIIHTTSVVELLLTILRTRLIFFVGCGMNDPLIRMALDECSQSDIRYVQPIAMLPNGTPPEILDYLQRRRVRILSFTGENRTTAIFAALAPIRPSRRGSRRLLIFEPGDSSKLRQTLTALENLEDLRVGSVTMLTALPELRDELSSWGRRQVPSVDTTTLMLESTSKLTADKIVPELGKSSSKWDGFFAPYEFAIDTAAEVVEAYENCGYARPFRFHSSSTAKISRDKRQFRSFLEHFCVGRSLVRNATFQVVKVPPNATAGQLLLSIKSNRSWPTTNLVVKPPDAGASIGVRPISIAPSHEAESIETLENFLTVTSAFSEQMETRACDTSEMLAEERFEGDEFSVESRRAGSNIHPEVIAIHWKPGIDADKLRFFERVYVTLPPGVGPFAELEAVNGELLRELKVKAGIFHAEYRVTNDIVRPLEVGLRPGGGMVNSQVRKSHGVDLFEAALLCAFELPQNPIRFKRVVASAEIFATKPGVLPPLTLHDDGDGPWLVGNRDGDLVKRWLQSKIDVCPRLRAGQQLSRLLRDDTPMCKQVLSAFNTSGIGLKARVDDFQLWLKPGELVTEEEGVYVAGLRVAADDGLEREAAVAEAVAAMEVCYHSIQCIPGRRLPELEVCI